MYRRALETQTRIIVASTFVLFDFGVVSVKILEYQKQFAEERKAIIFDADWAPKRAPRDHQKCIARWGTDL